MKNLNLVELLRDCPTGMELDCVLYDNATFGCIVDCNCYPIQIQTPEGNMLLSEYGRMSLSTHAKCVIFPKGKTTWEGFVPPCRFFKDGDIVATMTGSWIGITEGGEKGRFIPTYCIIKHNDQFEAYFDRKVQWQFSRLATEGEKQKLFDAIKANGYKWNTETKTLEKLVVPKFKVGDSIREKNNKYATFTISDIDDSRYYCGEYVICNICYQDNWELVPNKFDIDTLKPFEDKVLIRNDKNQRWLPAFWGYKVVDGFITTFGWCKYCIPYNGNEILFKTNNDCDDFYKTWENNN